MNPQATQLDGILSQLKAKGASTDEMSTVAKGFLNKTPKLSPSIISSPAPTDNSYQQRIANAQTAGVGKMGEAFKEGQNASNPIEFLEAGTKLAAGGIETLSAPISAAISPIVSPVINTISDKISNIPAVQKFAQSPAGVATSRITEDVANVNTIAGAVAGPEGVKPSLKTAGDFTSNVTHYVKGRIEGGDKNFEGALKDVTPNFKNATPTEKGELINQPAVNGTPRVQEGGFFSGREVTSTPHEAEIANKLSTVPGYKASMTALEKFNLTKNQIAVEGSQMRTGLQNESFIAPPKEIISVVRNAVNKVPESSLLLSKSDPVISNYMRVVNNSAKSMPGTLEGVLNLKQTLDAAYENARGSMAYGDSRMTSLDEVHTAARDALTQYMIKNARNTKVQAALRSQWLLYKASDVLSKTASKEAGSSIGRFGQNHPIIKNTAKLGVKSAGLGAGLHLIP